MSCSSSEADAFPKSGSTASHCDNFGHNDATSQPTSSLTAVSKTKMEFVGTAPCVMSPGRYRLEGRCSTELHSSPETPAGNRREVSLQSTELSVGNGSDPETHLPAHHQRGESPLAHAGEPALRTGSPRTLGSYDQHKALAERFKGVHPVSDSRVIPSSGDHVFNKTSYGYEASAAKGMQIFLVQKLCTLIFILFEQLFLRHIVNERHVSFVFIISVKSLLWF